MKLDDSMTPVHHSMLVNSWRVPMWVEEGTYTISVGQKAYRMFNESDLPEGIKSQLSMIHAFPFKDYPNWINVSVEGYINQQDERLNDVGWRLRPDLYMLVLNHEQLEEVANGNTRKQSKSQGS